MKRKCLLFILTGTLILGGCSYHQIEDNLRSELSKLGEKEKNSGGTETEDSGSVESNGAEVENNVGTETNETKENISDGDSELAVSAVPGDRDWGSLESEYTADPVIHFEKDTFMSELTGVQYQIRKAERLENYEQSGFQAEDVIPSDVVVPYLTGMTPSDFVVITVHVKRVSQHPMGETAIPKISYLCIIDAENYQPPDLYEGYDPAYFSGHPVPFDEDNYSNIDLAVGESAEYQVGYFVPKELAENGHMVLCIDFPTYRQQYRALEATP